ncbi:MAG: ribosome biogenesis factor YjgA [Burkholderiaceae bacterium]|jgi:ribosome-associated protein
MNAPPPPPPPTTVQRADDDVDLGPSKSQRKRDMHALQDLGERLVELPPSQLAKLALPQDLVDAIELARRITAREGRRRQLQYVGKLMRRVDADEIRARLDVDDVHHRLETAVMHAAERWRDTLIETPERLAEFVEKHPAAAALGLHTLLRGARHEHEKGVHGRHFRDLYRALRDVLLADALPGKSTATPDDA